MKRYDYNSGSGEYHDGGMTEDPDGEWVRYEDGIRLVIGDSRPVSSNILCERTIVICPACGCHRLLREWTEKTGYELMIRGYAYDRARSIWGEVEDGGNRKNYICPNCESFRSLDQIIPNWKNMEQADPTVEDLKTFFGRNKEVQEE